MRLTKDEQKYIKAMFGSTCKSIKDLPVTEIGLFLDNREQEPKEVWPLDHSISEKFLTFHGLPIKTSYKQYDARYVKKLEKWALAS
jgi:hypothetical protein